MGYPFRLSDCLTCPQTQRFPMERMIVARTSTLARSPFTKKVRGEAVTTWVKPTLVAEVNFPSGRTPARCGIRSIWDFDPTSGQKKFCASAKRFVSKSVLTPPIRNETRGSLVIGHAAAAPPSSVMNSRRFALCAGELGRFGNDGGQDGL
jgi:hypothetical protein